jgi:hypothetical protein
MARCPAHADDKPSLAIKEAGDGRVLVYCHAGCSQDAVIDALRDRGMWPDRPKTNGHTKPRAKVATYDYVDTDGTLVFQVVRYAPTDFRQRRPDGKGRWVWKTATRVVPYRLPEIQEAIASERPVFIVEGEKDVDNLTKLGIVATCNAGGASKWRAEHAAFLKGADVIIVPDNDDPGRQHAESVAASLTGIAARVRILTLPELPPKGDVSNWIENGGTAEQLWALAEEAAEWCETVAAQPGAGDQQDETSKDSKRRNDGARRTQAQTLIDIATGDGVDLYHSPDGTTYADIIVNGHRETWPTKSSGFKGFLRRTYYEQTGGAPNSDAMSTAMGAIDARAHFDGVTRHVYIRVASRTTLQGDEFIYIDRGDDAWEAIEVDGEGWRAIKAPPVRFRRAPGMPALPSPLLGGNISELRKHLNLSDDAFVLSVGWLLSALRGRGPYPILLLNGEQGAGKSTAADRLRRLVDPHAAPLRGLPRDVRDLAIAANNAHILAFDNLSGISADIADALCRLSTGGGFATRALYSDDEERFFCGMRPIVMNSIVDIATRPDLSDRGLVAVLEAIAAKERKTEREVRDAFDKAAPHILGALLDAVALGLKRESSVRLNRLPRMADHAVWVRACEPLDTQVGEQPWREGLHLDVYDRNRDEAAEIVLESDQVAMALRKHMDMRPESTTTSTDLLKTLGDLVPDHVRRSKDWPPNARALSGRLRRLAPALRGIGIVMSFEREGHDRRRLITIKKPEVQDAFQE